MVTAKKHRHGSYGKAVRPQPAASGSHYRGPGPQIAKLLDTPAAPIAITLMAYLRCLKNAFVYDDNEMIVLNRYIGDWALAWRSLVNDSWWFRNPLKLPQSAYYRPLQDVWLAVNFHLFGFAPAPWHLAIVAVHLIAVWLVFAIARELTDTRWTAPIAATIFGVLPIHAQAVVWPTAIPLPMAAMLELAALLAFIRRRRDGHAPGVLAPVFYALALLSHESAVAFPPIVLAYALIFDSQRPAAEKPPGATMTALRERLMIAGAESLAFFIELALYLAVRSWVLGFISRLNITNHMSVAQAWLTIPSVLGIYATLLIAPWRAGPVHPVEIVATIASRGFILPVLALIGLAGSSILALWNDPRRKLYLFCAIWLAISLVPMLNLRAFSPLAMVEDRYLYMGSAAWCIAIAQLLVSLCASIAPSGLMLAAGATAIAALYAGVLFHVESFWHDEVALFSTCVEMSPRSDLCHDRLGLALKQRGDLRGAEEQFLIADEINPNDSANLYNLGLMHAQTGHAPEAIGEMKRALAMLPDAPPGAYVELARIADRAGDSATRDGALLAAAKLPGGDEAAEMGSAELMITHRDFTGAESLLRAALAREPGNADGWTLLGNCLAGEGRGQEALAAYRRSLSLKPDPNLQRIVAMMHRR